MRRVPSLIVIGGGELGSGHVRQLLRAAAAARLDTDRIRVVENNFARMLEKQDQGNFQIATGSGWGADYPDAENFFFLFYSKNMPPAGKNSSRYVDPEFDKDFEQMSQALNESAIICTTFTDGQTRPLS